MPKSLTTDQYTAKLKEKQIENIEPIESYINSTTKILHRCIIHDEKFYIRPNDVLSGKTGCSECIKIKKKTNKKDHKQYVEEVAIKNPFIEVIGTYNGAYTKILHKCKIHDIIWDAIPHNILNGAGCRKCKIEKSNISKGYNHEWYVNELSIKNPNLEVVEQYKSEKEKILHRCKKHNVTWYVQPSDALRSGYGCVECKKEKIHDKTSRTHEQYCELLDKINSDIVPLETYYNGRTPILHLCKKHNIKWMVQPDYIISGSGCPVCSKENRSKAKSIGDNNYRSMLKKFNTTVIPLEKYISMNIPILHLCTIHNIKWRLTPLNALKGCGCENCRRERLSKTKMKTHEEYLGNLADLKLNNIKVLDTYKGANISIPHLCVKHNKIWYPTPGNVISGKSRGCSECNESLGESIIKKWLENNNIKYVSEKRFDDCKDSRSLPFDFYLIDLNKCIEYDGQQHFEPKDFFGGQEAFNKLCLHDKIKTEYCEQNNIPLLRIPYYEKDIETQLEQFIFN